MVKTEGLLLVIALLAISTGAFPTSDELLRPADAYSSVVIDPIDYNRMRREIAADSQADLTIANNKETPEELILPTKEGTPDDLAPPTREGATDGALTDEELSELARCGYGGGFGGGFNRPIIIPVPVNQGLQPSFVDVNLSRMNSLNTNNRPTIDLLTLLRLLG